MIFMWNYKTFGNYRDRLQKQEKPQFLLVQLSIAAASSTKLKSSLLFLSVFSIKSSSSSLLKLAIKTHNNYGDWLIDSPSYLLFQVTLQILIFNLWYLV